MEYNAAAMRPSDKRVCVYTRTWLSSGAGLFAQELVGGMVAAGARVTFIAPTAEDSRFEVQQPGLHRIRPPRERRDGASRPIRALWSFARVVRGSLALLGARIRHRTFLVTIPEPLLFSIPVLLLLRCTGARIIFVAHDPVPHAWRLPANLRKIEMAAHELCYRLSAAIVVLSEPSRIKLLEMFPRVTAPVHVIEHGVFLLGAPTQLPGNRRLLLFGSLRRNKGILQAIEGIVLAGRKIDVQLIVAGEPYREELDYWRACEEAAAKVPNLVEMHVGYVPDDALRAFFTQVDALLMPYDQFFSQSGVALLAASNARPVIASPVGGIAALLDEGMPAIPIALPVTAESVANGIVAFFDTPATDWRQRAFEYRRETLARRSWDVIGRQYVLLFGLVA
ncbi:glycosyltransferase family 4 protein [Sphingomonas faeni]|uniref:glycosyltransferase family 4 protein n=1 Tax=Sphingomonas faeni TaxID=185950 RepID=UPI003350CBD7